MQINNINRLLLSCLAFFALLGLSSCGSGGAGGAPISGNWVGFGNFGGNSFGTTMTLVEAGGALTGSFSFNGENGSILSGTRAGNTVNFSVNFPISAVIANVSGTFAGSTFAGSLTIPTLGGNVNISLNKQ